jgi:hypothetical protein
MHGQVTGNYMPEQTKSAMLALVCCLSALRPPHVVSLAKQKANGRQQPPSASY